MRILGELIVALILSTVGARVVYVKVLRPMLRRRHTEALIRENARLDQIARERNLQ